MILEQTLQLLKDTHGSKLDSLTIADVRIGIAMTAVRLSDDSVGTSSTYVNSQQHCIKHKRDYGDFSPLKIKGQKVTDLFETKKESGIITTLRIACLNAISSRMISKGDYNIIENCDPIDLIDLSSRKTITIVGAFHSYISRISETDNRLNVLELDENELNEYEKKYYVPARDYTVVLPESDIVIITGMTLVNSTIDNLLKSIPENSFVIVTGPSGSTVPDVLFANKVNMIGATRITRPDTLFDLIGEGGGGYHLFKYCAQKICIMRDNENRA